MLTRPVKSGIRLCLLSLLVWACVILPAGSLYEEETAISVSQGTPNRFKILRSSVRGSLPCRKANDTEARFRALIKAASRNHRVDHVLVEAIIMAESRFNPKAVSKRGAVGLMQLMPGTAEALGAGDFFNPEHNINAGVMYLRQLLDHYQGDLRLTLAAYNAGTTEVKRHGGVPPYRATHDFIRKVLDYYWSGKEISSRGNGMI